MKTLNMTAITLALCAGLVSTTALADRHDSRYSNRQNNRHTDFAQVITAEPIYRTVEQRIPVENCWTEQVREEVPVYQQASHRRPKSATGVILGSVIGGAIGNAVGAGDENKKVGTVVGAILGASVGHDISRHNRRQTRDQYSHTEVNYRNVERCEVSEKIETEQMTIGYDVTYRYQGRTYTTRMDRDPGRKLKVAVNIQPIE